MDEDCAAAMSFNHAPGTDVFDGGLEQSAEDGVEQGAQGAPESEEGEEVDFFVCAPAEAAFEAGFGADVVGGVGVDRAVWDECYADCGDDRAS